MAMMEFFLGIVCASICIKKKSCNLNPSNLLIASEINTGAKPLEVLYAGVLDTVGAVILPNILVEHLFPQQWPHHTHTYGIRVWTKTLNWQTF